MFDKDFLIRYNIKDVEQFISGGKPLVVTIKYNNYRKQKLRFNYPIDKNYLDVIRENIIVYDRKRKINKLMGKNRLINKIRINLKNI